MGSKYGIVGAFSFLGEDVWLGVSYISQYCWCVLLWEDALILVFSYIISTVLLALSPWGRCL